MLGFLGGVAVKSLPVGKEVQEMWVRSPNWEVPLDVAWHPTPVFLPGESQGQRSLAGCGPWGHRVGRDGSD